MKRRDFLKIVAATVVAPLTVLKVLQEPTKGKLIVLYDEASFGECFAPPEFAIAQGNQFGKFFSLAELKQLVYMLQEQKKPKATWLMHKKAYKYFKRKGMI